MEVLGKADFVRPPRLDKMPRAKGGLRVQAEFRPLNDWQHQTLALRRPSALGCDTTGHPIEKFLSCGFLVRNLQGIEGCSAGLPISYDSQLFLPDLIRLA